MTCNARGSHEYDVYWGQDDRSHRQLTLQSYKNVVSGTGNRSRWSAGEGLPRAVCVRRAVSWAVGLRVGGCNNNAIVR